MPIHLLHLHKHLQDTGLIPSFFSMYSYSNPHFGTKINNSSHLQYTTLPNHSMNNHTTIRGSSTSHNTELIKRRSSLGPEKHEPHYCKHFARIINPASIQDCAVLCWWFIVFLRLQPAKEHGNTLCLLLYIPENIYHSLAIKCLSPNSSYTTLTREKKIVKFASLLQQKKALGLSERNVQRCTVLFYQKPFFSSTEWKIC